MDVKLRIFLAIGVVIYFVLLVIMLKRRRIILKYTLMWMLAGLVLVVFLLWPRLVFNTSALIGISNPVNAVFLLFAACVLLLLLSLTSIVSQFNRTNRETIQALALLEKRVRELENEKATQSKSNTTIKPEEE